MQTRHYESIVEPVHAASAFCTMEALRGRRKDEQVPEGKEVPENEPVPESDPVPESQQKRKKQVKFTATEEQEICSYFATELAAKTTPTLWMKLLR